MPTKLKTIGAMWKPKPDAKSEGSGSVTIKGYRQRFVMLVNRDKKKPTQPDYVLMSSEEAEPDEYNRVIGGEGRGE